MSVSRTIYLVFHYGGAGQRTETLEYLPFGIMYVGQALLEAGFKVRLFHLAQGEDKELLAAVQEERPLFVGFTTMAGYYLAESIRLSRLLHEMGITIVWGGVYPGMVPELALSADYVDIIVQGEGEAPAVELAKRLVEGADLSGIPGVGFKREGALIIEPPAPPMSEQDLDKHRPAWELIALERYLVREPASDITSIVFPISRGCPFNCSFCYNVTDKEQRRFRIHSAGWAAEQLRYLRARLPLNTVALVGDNPFGHPRRGKEVLETLGLRWTAHCRLDMFDEDFMRWLDEYQCYALYIGIESGSDRMLKVLRKDITREEILQGMELLSKTRVYSSCGWMVLVPGETAEDRRQTFSLIDRIYHIHPRSRHWVNVYRPYPRTHLCEQWLQMGGTLPQTNEEWAQERLTALEMFRKSESWREIMLMINSKLYWQPKEFGDSLPVFLRGPLRGLWLNGWFGPGISIPIHAARSVRRTLQKVLRGEG